MKRHFLFSASAACLLVLLSAFNGRTVRRQVVADAVTAPTNVPAWKSKHQTLNKTKDMKNVFDFTVLDKKGQEVSLRQFEGKVLLIVNTASRCGFTPQYKELEDMYERLQEKGLEILDFPCNQFGEQAPGTDEEITQFCQLNYGTKFPQFKKCDVNGENEIPLYTFLKDKKGFEGFAAGHPLSGILDDMLSKADPDYARKPDIKWNFTKFLVNRDGTVVARFEPTHDMADVEAQVAKLLQ